MSLVRVVGEILYGEREEVELGEGIRTVGDLGAYTAAPLGGAGSTGEAATPNGEGSGEVVAIGRVPAGVFDEERILTVGQEGGNAEGRG